MVVCSAVLVVSCVVLFLLCVCVCSCFSSYTLQVLLLKTSNLSIYSSLIHTLQVLLLKTSTLSLHSSPISSVVQCLWEVFVWGFGRCCLGVWGVVLVVCVCVCVGVGGVVRCVCVCVCDLFIYSQLPYSHPAGALVPRHQGQFLLVRALAFTRYCHYQYCMVYGMQGDGRGGAYIALKSRNSITVVWAMLMSRGN